ncbi:MAG TPA: HD domain-containing protein [Candidatus Limnocylindrales bacterium]|nr:HD domain-containing protein [Candidatus Limnocylindrales bacterium]
MPALPGRIGPVAVPQDRISAATWRHAATVLPRYLFDHSVRAYCWGALLAEHDGLGFEPRILWPAALLHDVGLTRIGRSRACFEYDGADVARRFLLRAGMGPLDADRVARAIILHMAPTVTAADGAESVLLDRATGLDVRAIGADLVADRRAPIDAAFPRGAFDRHFLAAIQREVAIRTDCQSAKLLPRLLA